MSELKIIVVGLGGFGLKTIEEISYKFAGPTFLGLSNKVDDINSSPLKDKILLGNGVTTNHSKELGKKRVEHNKKEIQDSLSGYDVLILITALGYGTGSGGSPVVAKIAKDLGLYVITICTTPFAFEGQNRLSIAKSTIDELNNVCDSLIVIPNQNLIKGILKPQNGVEDKIQQVSNLIRYVVISFDSIFNFKDDGFNLYKKLNENSKETYFGIGAVLGEENALIALRFAAKGNLMSKSLSNANKVLLSIDYKAEVSNDTINLIYDEINNLIGHEVEIYYTYNINDTSGDILLLSLFASGDAKSDSVSSEFDKLKDAINPNNLI